MSFFVPESTRVLTRQVMHLPEDSSFTESFYRNFSSSLSIASIDDDDDEVEGGEGEEVEVDEEELTQPFDVARAHTGNGSLMRLGGGDVQTFDGVCGVDEEEGEEEEDTDLRRKRRKATNPCASRS